MSSIPMQATTLFPSLTCSDLQRSIDLYVKGLGFEIVDSHEEEGVLQYVMIRGGNAQMALGRDDFAKGRDRVKGTALRIWIETAQDLEALRGQMESAGFPATLVEPLPWGPMSFSFTDPDGFNVTVASKR